VSKNPSALWASPRRGESAKKDTGLGNNPSALRASPRRGETNQKITEYNICKIKLKE
jgi:hypothetical protein